MKEDGLLRPPRQERSRETLRRILKAAREMLREREFVDVTVDDIVERADSSKGSFYQRFADKDSLLIYLLREEHDEAIEAWSEFLDSARWEACSLRTVLDEFLDRLLKIYRGRPSLMRAYAGEVFGGQGEIRTLSRRLNRHILGLLRQIVREKVDEVGHQDPETATRFVLLALITLLPPLFLSPTQELFPEPMSPDALEKELRLLIHSYVGVALAREL